MYKNVYKYDDIKRQEHMAVRKTAGWYLWTHQLLEVTGSDASAFLDYLCPNPIGTLRVGRERYTTILNEKAEIIDDVVIFRMEDQKFWVSTLFLPDLTIWMDRQMGNYCVSYRDVTPEWHMYAVQGPKSLDMVNDLVATPVTEQKFFSITENSIDGVSVLINRAGFTGEKLGYEIYIAADKADFLEKKLEESAKKFDAREVTSFQIMAWTLPTEAGFYYMRDLRETNPMEVGLDKGIDWNKAFIGKDALLRIQEAGPSREMVGFTTEEADVYVHPKNLSGPKEADNVYKDGEKVGVLSKFVYSYVQERPVGYILAKKGTLKEGDRVKIRTLEAVITKKQFLAKNGRD